MHLTVFSVSIFLSFSTLQANKDQSQGRCMPTCTTEYIHAVATQCIAQVGTGGRIMDKLVNIRKTKKQVGLGFCFWFFLILPAASTYLEKCSLSICPNASDTDGSGHGG